MHMYNMCVPATTLISNALINPDNEDLKEQFAQIGAIIYGLLVKFRLEGWYRAEVQGYCTVKTLTLRYVSKPHETYEDEL